MKMNLAITALTSLLSTMPSNYAEGHGYMTEPATRNGFAHTSGTWGSQAGVPPVETTPHGLNSNTGVCGKQGGSKDYDVWVDSQGNPMPWISQTIYNKGQDIQVDVKITAHHYGHFTVSACPMGRASTQECFDANPLEFVEDTKYGMPKDENHPERAMLWGDGNELSYKLKLPDNIAGEQVLLQWIYWTANSCNYDGYQEYFNTHQTPASGKGNWSPALSGCGPIENIPMIRSGTVIAEIFVNCAEVSVSGESGPINPPPVPPPTTPVTDAPIVAPTNPPVVDPTIKPTNPPVVLPTNPPVVAPTSPPVNNNNNGNGCCSMDFKTCATWGNESRETCLALGSMTWLENGALENNTCLAKDSACTDNTHGCCPGLMCEGNEWYMQCKKPAARKLLRGSQ